MNVKALLSAAQLLHRSSQCCLIHHLQQQIHLNRLAFVQLQQLQQTVQGNTVERGVGVPIPTENEVDHVAAVNKERIDLQLKKHKAKGEKREKGKVYVVRGIRKKWDGKRFARCCIQETCDKLAQGATLYCKNHGGGRRCQQKDCVNAARGGFTHCARHGGGYLHGKSTSVATSVTADDDHIIYDEDHLPTEKKRKISLESIEMN